MYVYVERVGAGAYIPGKEIVSNSLEIFKFFLIYTDFSNFLGFLSIFPI